jgi:hypothetical protein
MNFLDYNEFVNESKYDFERRSVAKGSPMTAILKKSLERLGKSFKTDKDIVNAIEMLGFERESLKSNSSSAEYVFIKGRDKESGELSRYVTYSSGYVRAILPKSEWGRRHTNTTHNMTPVTDQFIPTPRERLLLVLRIALKNSDLYREWSKLSKSSDISVEEFLEKKRGSLLGKKFGI